MANIRHMRKKILVFVILWIVFVTGAAPLTADRMPVKAASADVKGTGIYKDAGEWKYFENGTFVQKSGLAKKAADGKWYSVKNGILNPKAFGLAKKLGTTDSAWYYVKKGKIKQPAKAIWVKPSKGLYDFYISKKGKVSKVRPKPNKITWIGDCLSVGMQQTPLIKSRYDFTFDKAGTFAHVSKSWTSAGVGGMNGKDTLDSLAKKKKIRPFLVIALGTNLAGFTDKKAMKAQIDHIMKKAGKDTKVVCMTSILKWGNTGERLNYNKVLRLRAKKYDNLYVADWAATVKNGWYTDRAHYTWEGNAQLFNCIITQVMAAAKARFDETYKGKTNIEFQ